MPVSREELFEQVWSEPMTKVAARYQVSSSYLTRVCERLRIPRPPKGYWATSAAGRNRKRPILAATLPGDEFEWVRPGEHPTLRPIRPAPLDGPPPRRRRGRPGGALQHPALEGAKELLQAAKEDDAGYLQPATRNFLDVHVSRPQLERALEFCNRLFLRLEDRGHRVMVGPRDGYYNRPALSEALKKRCDIFGSTHRGDPDRPTVVFVGTVAIGLTLFELSEAVEFVQVKGKWVRASEVSGSPTRRGRRGLSWTDWTTTRSIASGKLGLRAYSPYDKAKWQRRWSEAKPGGLHLKIPEIASSIEEGAVEVARLVEEARQASEREFQRWKEERARQEAEEAERRRLQAHQESRQHLSEVIRRWDVAHRTEAFFAELERRLDHLEDGDRQILAARIERARELLGGDDALACFRTWTTPEERMR